MVKVLTFSGNADKKKPEKLLRDGAKNNRSQSNAVGVSASPERERRRSIAMD